MQPPPTPAPEIDAMSLTHIQPEGLFQSQRFGFSQVVTSPPGTLVAVSGQVGWDENLKVPGPDLASQARKALENLRTALASVCCLAVLPMQDILSLGEGQRMNTPGTTEGNWQWRFEWSQIHDRLDHDLQTLLRLYDRVGE